METFSHERVALYGTGTGRSTELERWNPSILISYHNLSSSSSGEINVKTSPWTTCTYRWSCVGGTYTREIFVSPRRTRCGSIQTTWSLKGVKQDVSVPDTVKALVSMSHSAVSGISGSEGEEQRMREGEIPRDERMDPPAGGWAAAGTGEVPLDSNPQATDLGGV